MKKTILMLVLAMIIVPMASMAQQKKGRIEVLYFKANLACCKARACNALENEVKKIINQNFDKEFVTYHQIKLTDTTNNAIIKKYHAKSQTLVIVYTKRKKEKSLDASSLLRDFVATRDTARLKSDLISRINEISR